MKRLLLCFLLGHLVLPANAEVTSYDRPIHDAARTGDGREIPALLAADPKQREVRTGMGSTPLHLAATNPNTGPLKALLAAGADVHARDNEGATPLHMAAYSSLPKNTRILLEGGADPLAKTDNGRDAGSMARKVKGDETAGVIALWLLKGCKAGKPC